jgi:excisionase family DNA binding protein
MEELLTIQEVADILRADPTTARRWIKAGALEAVLLPKRGRRRSYRIRRSSIDALFVAQNVEGN